MVLVTRVTVKMLKDGIMLEKDKIYQMVKLQDALLLQDRGMAIILGSENGGVVITEEE